MPSKPRPEEIARWFKYGRRLYGKKNMPHILSIQDYEDKWIEWWSAAQPEWRNTNVWPFIQEDNVVERDWGSLTEGGKDGLFLVLISLGWWLHTQKDTRESSTGSKVDEAIADVTWVIEKIISSLAADATAPDTIADPTTTTPARPNKRFGSEGIDHSSKRSRT